MDSERGIGKLEKSGVKLDIPSRVCYILLMHRFLDKALTLLRKHEYPTVEHKLCAVIVRGGAIISVGYNSHDMNAFVKHYARICGNHKCHTTHAELDAIGKVRAKTDLRGCKIFVARDRFSGLGTARPCKICQRVLFEYGIKTAFYTITSKDGNSDEYGVMRITGPTEATDRAVQEEE